MWSWLIFERIGGLLAYLLARVHVPPAAATAAGGACGVGGAVLLGAARDVGEVWLAGALLLLSYSLDCADGQLARATRRATPAGAWLDVTTDSVVTTFLTVGACAALLSSGAHTVEALLLAGAFGASRIASLFTSTRVRDDNGGLQLTGVTAVLRTAYTALIDTPFVYVALCVTRLHPTAFRLALLAVTVLTVVQTAVSAHRHFTARTGHAVGRDPKPREK